ncbi:MAG: virulence RhuM family protein [Campylobacterota bacterium]|nr:virulence RhuM family protein [Campylobacterota bacterium]
MSEMIIYQSEDGTTNLDIKLENETLWLSQKQLAELFGVTTATINEHIKNIYKEKELEETPTIRNFLIVQQEGSRKVKRDIEHYNLDMIISVGYRVKSNIATKFRQWATARLKEYVIKGFVMDDERLKEAKNSYFDELLERIRDIRSSEKVFWKKVLDIYATSVDYDANDERSQDFFKTIQNKMHFATHGHTAAEIVHKRVDSTKENVGMTNFSGNKPTKKEASIAKNYLIDDELDTLNRIVTSYLEFAELQAKKRKTMKMQDWIKKLDDFLTLSDFEILNNRGVISHKQALKKANEEYDKYKAIAINEKSRVESDFEDAIKSIENKNG